jgi:hypothetical protein
MGAVVADQFLSPVIGEQVGPSRMEGGRMNPQDFQRIKRQSMIGQERDRTPSTTFKVSSVAAGLAGWAVGRYSGINLLIPFAASVIFYIAAKKLLPKDKQIIVPAFSVQAGHLTWLLVGMLITKTFSPYWMDVVWCLGGLVWLAIQPGKGALLSLVAYQLFSLAINGYAFVHAPIGSDANKALLVHVIWRTLALYFMGRLYLQLRQAISPAVDPEVTEPPR